MTREEAIAELTCILNHEGEYMDYLAESEVEAIKTLAEERQGEWIWCDGDGKTCTDGWICSSCGKGYHTKVPYFDEFKFCPNCGASMKGGDKK